jgi:hypothetical protein
VWVARDNAIRVKDRRGDGHSGIDLRGFVPANLVTHVSAGDPETHARLLQWTSYFASQGSDSFTAQRRAVAMIYRETVAQAQLLAYADDFWLLAMMFAAVPLILPFMRRVRLEPKSAAAEKAKEAAAEVSA